MEQNGASKVSLCHILGGWWGKYHTVARTINCDLCGELFTAGDTAALVEDHQCNADLCNPRARAHHFATSG
jgi:hypothetical protein